MNRLKLPAGLGETVVNFLEAYNDGQEIAIIIIAIPVGENPQPSFCTNLEPDNMEQVLQEIGTQLPEIRQSRIDITPESLQ